MRRRGVHSIFIAARGTSDNAALYAKYLWGSVNGLPVALAAPSLFTLYRTPPRLDGDSRRRHLAVGPVAGHRRRGQEGRTQGALTLAITNDPSSPLAAAADMVLDTVAGPENAVAASKTYTAQLLAIALLSAASRTTRGCSRSSSGCRSWWGGTRRWTTRSDAAAERYRYMDQCVVLGRGFNYATAYEWSLKLKEMTYVVAEPYSSADFRHGPVAIVWDGFPVLAVAPAGAVFDDTLALLDTLAGSIGRSCWCCRTRSGRSAGPDTAALPADLPEWLSPLVAIVPGQLFSYHLTRAKGHDTETPRRLRKITRTCRTAGYPGAGRAGRTPASSSRVRSISRP